MQWNSDPELRSLRNEFIGSFEGRRQTLLTNFTLLRDSGTVSAKTGPAFEIRVVAHNLAGAAGSYGLDGLGRIATALDDYLVLSEDEVSVERLLEFTKLLIAELTSCVESLAVEANS